MTNEDLKKIIDLHKLWSRGEEGGKIANLSGANLREANLCEVDLHEASLIGANLHGANLCRSDLHDANLVEAKLNEARLCGADLYDALLTNADLRQADMCGTDLREAHLADANLRGANLDFSCWPLWCGSFNVKIDKRIFCQLVYHLCRTIVDDNECKAAQRSLIKLANQFHRVDECGAIEEELFSIGVDEENKDE